MDRGAPSMFVLDLGGYNRFELSFYRTFLQLAVESLSFLLILTFILDMIISFRLHPLFASAVVLCSSSVINWQSSRSIRYRELF